MFNTRDKNPFIRIVNQNHVSYNEIKNACHTDDNNDTDDAHHVKWGDVDMSDWIANGIAHNVTITRNDGTTFVVENVVARLLRDDEWCIIGISLLFDDGGYMDVPWTRYTRVDHHT